MNNPVLTSDNIQLSRVNRAPSETPDALSNQIAIDCNLALASNERPQAGDCLKIKESVYELVRASLSENTQRAYASDLTHFMNWGGRIPAEAEMVAGYLADHSEALSVATLSRRVATISKAHAAQGYPNPCSSELVKSVMRGIRRTRGAAQKQAKPLLRDDLFRILDNIGDDARGMRDRALLLVGFAGGFRRSELVGLDVADLQEAPQGIIVTLRHSKTDQERLGRPVGVPYGRTRHCPVLALKGWMSFASLEDGPIFRPINRHGQIASERLSGDAVSEILRSRASDAGLATEGLSGHSLRAGFATSAAQAGVPTLKIRAQTGHASDAMVARYIRDGELFIGNAVATLL